MASAKAHIILPLVLLTVHPFRACALTVITLTLATSPAMAAWPWQLQQPAQQQAPPSQWQQPAQQQLASQWQWQQPAQQQSSRWQWQQPAQQQPPSQSQFPQQQQPQSQATTQPPQQLRMDEIQILLDRCGFSVGQIDGQSKANTHKAVAAFQQTQALPATGELDAVTMARLWEASGGTPWTHYTITDEDAAGPFIGELPATMEEKSRLDYLGYTTIYAKLGEKFHINSALLRSYNSKVSFKPRQTILAPNVVPMELSHTGKATTGQAWNEFTIVASKNNMTLQLLDSQGRILFHAPITLGGKHDPLPLGKWKVEGIDRNPSYHYDPSLFWDANTSDAKCILPPGPNNPVGVVWVNINREHVGIHGTPSPGKVGYAVSHGCIRLTNWDVIRLAALIGPGTNVLFKE